MTERIRPYVTRHGKAQFKPSLQMVKDLAHDNEGFCLACGETQGQVEPDIQHGICDCCGAKKIYGAETLIMVGLVF